VQQRSLGDIKRRISTLHHEAAFANPVEKPEMYTLLCKYYLLVSAIAYDQMCLDESIGLINRVITIAEENTLYDVWSFALRDRGLTYLERAEIIVSLKGFAAAQADLMRQRVICRPHYTSNAISRFIAKRLSCSQQVQLKHT